ncbi:MAG: glutathione S-transferase family protein [Rhizobiales bacterium]|nr:glutathione S-transferase family protein [Hyphomicrobiales bacterium]
MKLIIGNKNYSSWSMRPWFAMRMLGIPFEEEVLNIGGDDFRERVLAVSPGGRVPVLVDGATHVWDSLAIVEYLADRFPDLGVWPAAIEARAHARSISCEMHSGFMALRSECPMNMWRPAIRRQLSEQAGADAARIDALWMDCRRRYAADGPFLFGRFSGADAMYAPVVSRFITYEVEVGAASRAYMEAVAMSTAFEEWRAAAIREAWVLANGEPDWPTVLKV